GRSTSGIKVCWVVPIVSPLRKTPLPGFPPPTRPPRTGSATPSAAASRGSPRGRPRSGGKSGSPGSSTRVGCARGPPNTRCHAGARASPASAAPPQAAGGEPVAWPRAARRVEDADAARASLTRKRAPLYPEGRPGPNSARHTSRSQAVGARGGLRCAPRWTKGASSVRRARLVSTSRSSWRSDSSRAAGRKRWKPRPEPEGPGSSGCRARWPRTSAAAHSPRGPCGDGGAPCRSARTPPKAAASALASAASTRRPQESATTARRAARGGPGPRATRGARGSGRPRGSRSRALRPAPAAQGWRPRSATGPLHRPGPGQRLVDVRRNLPRLLQRLPRQRGALPAVLGALQRQRGLRHQQVGHHLRGRWGAGLEDDCP
ncbi:unnamed protein product, partial [Prorocentrum cordatum]